MDSFEIRKNGELIETIVAHEFQMRGKNTAIFSLYGQPQTVIVLEPGMRVERVAEPPRPSAEDIGDRLAERIGHANQKAQDDPPTNVIEFPR